MSVDEFAHQAGVGASVQAVGGDAGFPEVVVGSGLEARDSCQESLTDP
jgi:hypothetical protein